VVAWIGLIEFLIMQTAILRRMSRPVPQQIASRVDAGVAITHCRPRCGPAMSGGSKEGHDEAAALDAT
jgi:hypothetical protein